MEAGKRLSGGEKQRISIARAILKDAPIIILDEATASVDPENEHLIQAAISELTKEKTIVTIAHRLVTIEQADQILVLDQGKVADIGTHEQLISREGIYQDIYQIQMNNADRELLRQVSEEQPTESRRLNWQIQIVTILCRTTNPFSFPPGNVCSLFSSHIAG